MEAAKMPWPALGALLLRDGKLTVQQLEQALAEKERVGKRLGEILVERRFVSGSAVAEALAEQYELEFVDFDVSQVDPAAAVLLPERQARKFGALAIGFENDETVRVAIGDPTNVMAADELRMSVGMAVRFVAAAPDALQMAIDRFYRADAELVESDALLESGFDQEHDRGEEPVDIRDAATTAPAIKLVNALIARAIDEGASDIHFEPQAKHVLVRARVDGVLRRMTTIPRQLQRPVASRLKIMAELDITDRRGPQDGRMTIRLGGQSRDLRAAVIPTTHGEHIVLRIMNGASERLSLHDLGMAPRDEAVLARAIRQPHGAVIVCGPTGSGKTTTLYAALDELNDEETAIQTIEDPVEAQIAGVNQVEVFPPGGLTFASGLRTILRSDPDVLLVGEIRDEETARIAIQAAMTGHLVLSSLHSPSAAGAFARLMDMGIEPGLLATAMSCVVSQRLVRKLCSACLVPYEPSVEELESLGVLEPPPGLHLHGPGGCGKCGGTGFAGRIGIYEAIEVDPAVRRVLGESTEAIFAAAVAAGTRTVRQDGTRLVLAGLTSRAELERVVGDR